MLFTHLFLTCRYQIAITVLGLLCLSWFVASFLTTPFQCMPTAGAWNINVKSQCICFSKMAFGIAISNIGTDCLILILTLHTIRGLCLPRRQKLVLSLLFLTGSLCVSFFGTISIHLIASSVCATSILCIINFRHAKPGDLPYNTLFGAFGN